MKTKDFNTSVLKKDDLVSIKQGNSTIKGKIITLKETSVLCNAQGRLTWFKKEEIVGFAKDIALEKEGPKVTAKSVNSHLELNVTIPLPTKEVKKVLEKAAKSEEVKEEKITAANEKRATATGEKIITYLQNMSSKKESVSLDLICENIGKSSAATHPILNDLKGIGLITEKGAGYTLTTKGSKYVSGNPRQAIKLKEAKAGEAQPMTKKERVVALIEAGTPYNEISEIVGCDSSYPYSNSVKIALEKSRAAKTATVSES